MLLNNIFGGAKNCNYDAAEASNKQQQAGRRFPLPDKHQLACIELASKTGEKFE